MRCPIKLRLALNIYAKSVRVFCLASRYCGFNFCIPPSGGGLETKYRVLNIIPSALESVESIAARLQDTDIALHFSEIKAPIMNKLKCSDLHDHLHGRVLLTNYQAIQALTPQIIR